MSRYVTQTHLFNAEPKGNAEKKMSDITFSEKEEYSQGMKKNE